MVRVQLCGVGQRHYEELFLIGFPSQQYCLLPGYLLLNRHRPHHREQLDSQFWSDYRTATSLKHLRNGVWRLRGAPQSLVPLGGHRTESTVFLTVGHRAPKILPSFPQTLLASAVRFGPSSLKG